MPIYDDWILRSETNRGADLPITSPILRSILARRGVTTAEDYRHFVAPCVDDLHDGSAIHGMDVACERIFRAIRGRERILIYGDYDVDGVTSIVLLRTVLQRLGADVGFVVPHRLLDGYGLKSEVLERVEKETAVRLVITVDCGITSIEPVRSAIERGIDVIITDHHLPPEALPEAAAVLNPRQPGCSYPFKELAGVGVAFKLCCELLRRGGSSLSILSLLKIAALGTVADVAPLVGENRTIVSLGLKGLADSRNIGLRALMLAVGVAGRGLSAGDVGFKIGPRINAAGRLASADTAIELFGARDDGEAVAIVAELNRLNRERQQIEATVRSAAEEQISLAAGETILVLAGENWHRGVLGLAAGRIAQKYHRPVLAISIENGTCVGSGRSIPTVDLHGALQKCSDLFTHFGGHEFACGFSLPLENLESLRKTLSAQFREQPPHLFRRSAFIEGELSADALTKGFMAEHQQLEPFGAGNPQPLFLLRDLAVARRREFADRCHEITLEASSCSLEGVLWPSEAALADSCVPGARLDLLVHARPSQYAPNGIRLELVDAAPAGATAIITEIA